MVKSTFLEENLWVLAWMPDGDLIATGGRGKKLFLLSSSQMTPTCKPFELEGSVWSIDFMPRTVSLQVGVRANAYSIAVGTSDCAATIYDVGTFQPTLRVLRPRTVRCLSYHPLLPLLALGDSGNTVSIVDLFGEETSHELNVAGRVNAVAFSPVGDLLVIGTDEGLFTFHETSSFRIVQEIKVNGFALSAAFSGSSGQHLALGSGNDGYTIVRLGPFLGTDLIPLGSTGGVDHLPSWAFNEALYRSGDGPSLVQRNMIEGSQDSLRRAAAILQDRPDAIYAFDRSTGDGCFQTALQLKKPNLLKLVMITLVDGTLETDSNGRRTILTTDMPDLGLDTLKHKIASFPSQYIVEILAEMTYIKVPFTEPREISTTNVKESGSSSYADPWDYTVPQRRELKRAEKEWKIEVDDGKGFVYRTPAVLPLPGLGSADFLSSLLDGAPPTVFDNAAMGLVLHVMWEQFIRPYFLLDLIVFLFYCVLWTLTADWTTSTASTTNDNSSGVEDAMTMCLIVLNTLFAIKEITDCYARVQEKAVANQRKERAELIVEYLSILPPPKRREIEKNTRYFHALLEADEDGDLLINKDDWQGGLNALRRDLEEMNAHGAELTHQAMADFKASIDNDIAALRREIVGMLQDVSNDMKEMRRVQKEGGVTFNGSNVAKAVRAVKSIGKNLQKKI